MEPKETREYKGWTIERLEPREMDDTQLFEIRVPEGKAIDACSDESGGTHMLIVYGTEHGGIGLCKKEIDGENEMLVDCWPNCHFYGTGKFAVPYERLTDDEKLAVKREVKSC